MATLIPQAQIDEIRQTANIVDIVGQQVELSKSGKNYFGLCPFHDEKTPSFSVNEEKQIFHCFSCHRGGNVFSFIMQTQNVTFPQSVYQVADIIGFTLDQQYNQPKQTPESKEKQALKDLYTQAAELFNQILTTTQAGDQALAYAYQRGLSDELIADFGIGFLPDKDDFLLRFFKSKNVDYQLLRQSGLFIETQTGELHDRFSGRLLFPIKDEHGSIIAFSGRLLQPQTNAPKYLNSPETLIFNKRKVLFNIDRAKIAGKTEKTVYLFEGFMDVIAAYSAGLKNGVASMGTSLTDEQIHLIKHYFKNTVISYDGDAPGQEATKRAGELLEKKGQLDVKIVSLPGGLDPDEYLKQNSKEKLYTVLTTQFQTPVAFELAVLKQQVNLNNESQQLSYIQQALMIIAKLDSPVAIEIHLKQLSESVNIAVDALKRQLQTLVVKEKTQPTPTQTSQSAFVVRPPVINQQRDQVENAQRQLLKSMMQDRQVLVRFENDADFTFVQTPYQLLFELLKGYHLEHQRFDIASFIDYIPSDLQNLAIAIEQQELPEINDDLILEDYKQVIAKQQLKEQLKTTKIALNEAIRLGDQQQELALTQTILKLTQQLQA